MSILILKRPTAGSVLLSIGGAPRRLWMKVRSATYRRCVGCGGEIVREMDCWKPVGQAADRNDRLCAACFGAAYRTYAASLFEEKPGGSPSHPESRGAT